MAQWNALSDGWEKDGNSGKWKAELNQKISKFQTENSGTQTSNTKMVVVVSPSTGAYDVYQKDRFGRRSPIYRFSPATGKSTPLGDGTLYKRAFRGTAGEAQLRNLNQSVKQATIQNLKNHPTDTVAQRNLAEIRKTNGYKSLANNAEDTSASNGNDNPTNSNNPEGAGDDRNPSSGDNDGSTREIEPVDLDTSKTTGTRTNFGNLNYPETRDPGQDIIKFDMLEYEPKKVEGFSFSDRSSDTSQRTLGSVTLPIPGGISDANACNWGDNTMNPLQIAGASIALAALDSDAVPGGIGGAFGEIKKQVQGNSDVIQEGIGAQAAASAIGSDINTLLGRTQGMILNPNLELLFQGPSLRPFSFQFKLSPRSRSEAKEIVKIIRFFKQGMAPIREKSRLFLRTPNTFKIKYVQLGRDSESPFMNKFKECALLSCNVQYTPEGNYAPYDDGAMSSYVMSLQFKELEPVYNDDYGNEDVAAVGF